MLTLFAKSVSIFSRFSSVSRRSKASMHLMTGNKRIVKGGQEIDLTII